MTCKKCGRDHEGPGACPGGAGFGGMERVIDLENARFEIERLSSSVRELGAKVEKLRAERDAARKEAAKWERAAHRAAAYDPDV